MADQYFYTHETTQCGPFPAARMRELAAAGGILPTDPVWKEGTEQRVSAVKVKNLFADLKAKTGPADLSGVAVPPASATEDPDLENGPADALLPAIASEPVAEPEDLPAPEKPAAAKKQRAQEQFKVRKKRVVSIKGAVLVSQDGVDVRYRKKCSDCGHEDSSRSSTKIPSGTKRDTFFCPTCRRVRVVEILGTG